MARGGAFGAWLTRIGVRIAVRKAGKRRTVSGAIPAELAMAADGTPRPARPGRRREAMAAAPLTDPGDPVDAGRARHRVRAAVTALPEPYREVVALRFFGEASLEEIARQTDRPLSTVKTHLHRGLGPPASSTSSEASDERLGRRFDPAELGRRPAAAPADADAAGLLATARDLEAFAPERDVMPTTDFEDRVMAAIANEPPPRAVALRAAWPACSWRSCATRGGSTWSGGRPLAVRAQAFALVLVAALAVGSVGSLAAGVSGTAGPECTADDRAGARAHPDSPASRRAPARRSAEPESQSERPRRRRPHAATAAPTETASRLDK